MGLDMYAYKTKRSIDSPVDFPMEDDPQIAHWRKFNNLHGWMARLYVAKGGMNDFNCDPVLLTSEDLDQLEKDAIEKKNLDPLGSFFFDQLEELSDEEQKEILDFVKKAREEITAGYQVYYTSWW